ncbi:radical SAM/SPASM domain-containing protein [Clostridium oryzae]|uniref:Radical SAM core domain-containing protein n=1 Tax=Clostridium oryzae TaxID=1450648 RepID=A0A1V4IVT6_9CLOT|nr:radical SAM protein [Clostridium oryzae]OPJ64168.1 hypothetical protein CLORY_07160 [Clostridium oryzae]
MEFTVWTTDFCNLHCRYCYEGEKTCFGNMNDYFQDLTLKSIKKSISQSDDNKHIIRFHGGEPLLNFKLIKRFVDDIEEFKGNLQIKYEMTTNGTVWNEEIDNFFRKYRKAFEGYISISIDGDKNIHNRNRVFGDGNGSFNIVIETAKKMLSIFKNLRCRMTITPNNVEDMFENTVYIKNLGFENIASAFDLFSKEWNEECIEIIQNQQEKIIDYWYKNNLKIVVSTVYDIQKQKRAVGICSPSVNYYPDGFIYPCTFVAGREKFNIGTIENGIDSDKLQCIKDISIKDNSKCIRCNNKRACEGNRCKLLNKVTTGDYYVPPTIECVLERIKLKTKNKYNDILIDM